jgi:hypothetical protein
MHDCCFDAQKPSQEILVTGSAPRTWKNYSRNLAGDNVDKGRKSIFFFEILIALQVFDRTEIRKTTTRKALCSSLENPSPFPVERNAAVVKFATLL